jgi:hypothetical protein
LHRSSTITREGSAVKRLEISLFGAQDEAFELGQPLYRF